MIKQLKFLLATVLLSAIFFACSDKTNNPDDTYRPELTSIYPKEGYTFTEVTITGNHLGTNSTGNLVKIGSIEADWIVSWNDTEITFRIPEQLAPGKYPVVVSLNGSQSNPLEITVLAYQGNAPIITSTSKSVITEGETIKLYGRFFGADQGNSYVEFNGKKATVYPLWSDDSIVARAPDGISSGNVIVWVNGIPSNGFKYLIQLKFKLLNMVSVKAGTFTMGDNNDNGFDNKPAHEVTITKDFEISETEITQKDWKTIMSGSNPSHPSEISDSKPVQQVTFIRAIEFCNRLSEMEGYTPAYTINGESIIWNKNTDGYRLPTEAEWEYACRADRNTPYTLDEVKNMAWVSENSGNRLQEVKKKQPNAWNIYDMLGNVAEWCWDYYDADYYAKSPKEDPSGPATSDFKDRIKRGGSFVNGAESCNSAYRDSFPSTNDNYNYNLGFRVVRNK